MAQDMVDKATDGLSLKCERRPEAARASHCQTADATESKP